MSIKIRRYVSMGILPVLIALPLSGCGQGTSNKVAIVATYKGGTVTQTEMDNYINVLSLVNPQVNASTNTAKTQIVQQYIAIDRILANKATQAGFKASSATIQNETSQFKNQVIQQSYNNSTQSFNQKVQSLKLTGSDVSKTISNELAVEQYAASLIPKSDLNTYYKQHLSSFTLTTQHGILVKSKAQAEKIYTMLQANHSASNWDKLAKEYSQDPGSKNNGGLYTNQPASNWVPQYAKAVTTQPIGKVGQPFDTTYGWFVVEVLARTVEPLSTVTSQVKNQMLSDASSKYAFTNLVNQAEKQADIKVTLPSSGS
ncbi:peptidylprolyl isomerase [Alicyclobacillus tolerans]|uniref:peptidylprolyl isomerase n=1 Tax=Alicyclobacillus tolerans TaxID=90970 RepID=UPI001F28281A|nr:peptidylprolyl isomerase [Alicyclobacillus tolerans]MCF8567575.1 peptidylprolyl isomerase [Alicyclobacillus tolerans]